MIYPLSIPPSITNSDDATDEFLSRNNTAKERVLPTSPMTHIIGLHINSIELLKSSRSKEQVISRRAGVVPK